jgi:hypothetical protein
MRNKQNNETDRILLFTAIPFRLFHIYKITNMWRRLQGDEVKK